MVTAEVIATFVALEPGVTVETLGAVMTVVNSAMLPPLESPYQGFGDWVTTLVLTWFCTRT
jgi:hypothetical protein